MPEETQKSQEFNEALVSLVIGLQSTAWISLGKIMHPATGKVEVNLDRARDSIDTLLMLKEKTKGNLTETEKGLLETAMQDLELNFIEVKNEEDKKKKEEKNKSEEKKEDKK